jgi:hypothetical protein
MHYCPTIIYHCIDFRLIKETMRFIDERYGLGTCDIVSVAGAGKGIADDEEKTKNIENENKNFRCYLLRQAKLSYTLHGSRKVVLIHHSDCGAYNSFYKFKSGEEEKQKQIEDMRKAETIIKKLLPDVAVEKVWAQMLDSKGEKVNFIIVD